MGLNDVLETEVSKEEFIRQFHKNFDSNDNGFVSKNDARKFLIAMGEDNKPYKENSPYKPNILVENGIKNITEGFYRKNKINFSPLQEDCLAPIGRVMLEADVSTTERTSGGNDTYTQDTINTANGTRSSRTTDSHRYERTTVTSRKEYIQSKSPYKDQLLDNDVKKANEAIPTTLNIELRVKGAEHPTHILMGIKTITHTVDSEEMIYNVASAIRERRLFFRFIQWTSGEIKFFKDFVLCLDRIKTNIDQNRNKTNWWRVLKNRARTSRMRVALGKDALLPNSTLVLSMDEVDYIANAYGINLLKETKTIQRLLVDFNLLGICIVDSSSELVYLFYDGEESFQTFSYNALERENRNSGNDLKALVSLMSR